MRESIENPINPPKLSASFVRAGTVKTTFPHSRCVIFVNPGEPDYEGTKLLALIRLINKNFKEVDLIVADSLERHNLMLRKKLSLDNAHENANAQGAAWRTRNEAAIAHIEIPCHIFRWDKWLLKPEYEPYRQELFMLYWNDPEYKATMTYSIQEYLSHPARRDAQIPYAQAFMSCLNYLTEECAVIARMWPEQEYHFILSASKPLKIMTLNHDRFVKPVSSDIQHWLQTKLSLKK